MLETTDRAQTGGEIGVNGESYKGGQFLPSSPYTRKGQHGTRKGNGQRKARKIEIAPYTWEVAPDGMTAIYSRIVTLARMNRTTGLMELCAKPQTLAYFKTTEAEVAGLIEKWNKGERWQ